MCSGCSGSYSGDYDDSGEPTPDLEDDAGVAWNCGEPKEHGNPQSTRKAAAFKGGSSNQYPQRKSISPEGGQSAAEFWEILVSETRIVEIHVIEANSGEVDRMASSETARRPAVHRHSRVARAKYYRTRPIEAGSSAVGPKRSRSRWAALATTGFREWLRWARRAFALSFAKSL